LPPGSAPMNPCTSRCWHGRRPMDMYGANSETSRRWKVNELPATVPARTRMPATAKESSIEDVLAQPGGQPNPLRQLRHLATPDGASGADRGQCGTSPVSTSASLDGVPSVRCGRTVTPQPTRSKKSAPNLPDIATGFPPPSRAATGIGCSRINPGRGYGPIAGPIGPEDSVPWRGLRLVDRVGARLGRAFGLSPRGKPSPGCAAAQPPIGGKVPLSTPPPPTTHPPPPPPPVEAGCVLLRGGGSPPSPSAHGLPS